MFAEQESFKAILEYEWIRKDLIDLWHTEVPSEFRGHGVAKYLVKVSTMRTFSKLCIFDSNLDINQMANSACHMLC